MKRRYFCERARLLHVAPEVRAMVSFRRHLLHDHLGARRLGRWDVIVCRDALSWLDGGTRAEVLGTLCDQLADDGVLLLAPGERVRMGGLPLVGLGVGAPGVYVREGGVGHRGA